MHTLNHPAALAAVRPLMLADASRRTDVPTLFGRHGQLSVAINLDRPDDTESHGRLALVRNDQLSWQAILSAPAGWQHRSSILSGNVCLRNGTPAVEFVPMLPVSEANLVSSRVAIDWLDGPDGQAATADLSRYLPRPFLQFDRDDADGVISAVLAGEGGFPTASAVFRRFCRSLATGLVLRTTGPELYLGIVGKMLAGRLHRLRSTIDRTDRIVRLPEQSRMLVRPAQTLEPGRPWVQVLDRGIELPEPAQSRGKRLPWPQVRRACGGSAAFRRLMLLWLSHQQFRLPSDPGALMMPASLVGRLTDRITPTAIWWDTAPMLPRYDWQSQSAVLPMLTLAGPQEFSPEGRVPGFGTARVWH